MTYNSLIIFILRKNLFKTIDKDIILLLLETFPIKFYFFILYFMKDWINSTKENKELLLLKDLSKVSEKFFLSIFTMEFKV